MIEIKILNRYHEVPTIVAIPNNPGQFKLETEGLNLSWRQLQILFHKANYGLTEKGIARSLGITRQTVKTHIEEAKTSNEINGRRPSTLGLVLKAEQRGLLDPINYGTLQTIHKAVISQSGQDNVEEAENAA